MSTGKTPLNLRRKGHGGDEDGLETRLQKNVLRRRWKQRMERELGISKGSVFKWWDPRCRQHTYHCRNQPH